MATDTPPRYEFFDHTADIGIRASAPSLEALFIQLARGLTALIAEDSTVASGETRPIRLEAPDAEALLLKWLQELLFWFSADGFLAAEYALSEVTPTSLGGLVRGERFDPARHQQGREVKAITRHLLEVRQEDGAWRGQVIVDI